MLRRTIVTLALLILCSGQRAWIDGDWHRAQDKRRTQESETMAKTTRWFGTEDDALGNVNNYDNGLPVDGDTLLFPEDAVLGPATDMDAFNGTKATGILTLTGNAGNTETVTIKDTVYTWKTAISTAFDVLIGGSASESIDNLIAAINGGAGSGTLYHADTVAHTRVDASAGAGDTMDVTAKETCELPNSFATSSAMASGSWGGAVLTGGVDFVFELIFVGRDNGFDIGTQTSPFATNATKIVHQGSGAFYFEVAGAEASGLQLTEAIIINSDRQIDAIPAFTGSGIVDGKINNVSISKGYGLFEETLLAIGDLVVSYRTNVLSDARADISCPVLSSVLIAGGVTVLTNASPVRFSVMAGIVTLSGAPLILGIFGGFVEFNGTSLAGTGASVTVLFAGTLDMTQTTKEKTIAELYKAPDAVLLKSDDLVTITKTHDLLGGDTP